MGPKFAGVCSNGLENIDCLEVAGVRDFFFLFLFFKGISSSNFFKGTEVKVPFFSSLVYFIGLFVTPWLQNAFFFRLYLRYSDH